MGQVLERRLEAVTKHRSAGLPNKLFVGRCTYVHAILRRTLLGAIPNARIFRYSCFAPLRALGRARDIALLMRKLAQDVFPFELILRAAAAARRSAASSAPLSTDLCRGTRDRGR